MKQCLSIYCLMLCLLLFLPQVLTAQADNGKDSPEAYAKSLNQSGIDYQQKNDYPQAEANFQKAISLCRKQHLKQQLGYSLYNLSALYAQTENYEKAIKLAEESLALLEKYNDKEAIAKCLMNLEVCWKEHGVFISAMSYANQAVEVLRTIKNDKLLELELWRQGEIYREMNTELAIPMFKEALALAEKIPEYHNLDNILTSLGYCYTDVYVGDVNLQLAEKYLLQALQAAERYDPGDVNECRIHYSKIFTMNGKYKEAEYHIKLVYADAAAANDTDMLSTASFCLAEVYFGMKNYQKAYEYLKKHEMQENAYYEKQKKGTEDKMAFNFKTGRIETQHKLLLQQRELQKVKLEQESFQKNVKIGISVTVALFLLAVTFLVSGYFKKKNLLLSKKSGTLRQQLLLTQMSPHFITSSINTIQTLIKQDKPDIAATYLSKFARLTRQILENSTGQLISLEEEIAMITNYLAVQQLLYQEGFSFTIDDNAIETEAIYIPPMLTLPLLTQVVKRLVAASGQERSVTVNFRLKNKRLAVTVQDSGDALKPGEKLAILESADVQITAERLGEAVHFTYSAVSINNVITEGSVTGVVMGFEVPYVED